MKRTIKILVILFTMMQIVNGQIITTIAGDSVAGYNHDTILAVTAELNQPRCVAIDASGNVYIADFFNHRVRKITVSTGIITTIAGTGTSGYNGDNLAATSAELSNPNSVALDDSGNIYISDGLNRRVRKVTVSTGIISTIAGTGIVGYNGDGIAADTAQLKFPVAVALDDSGNVYIVDQLSYRIRKVTKSTGLISTLVDSTQVIEPSGIALDGTGNIYISEFGPSIIIKLNKISGIIDTLAGTSTPGYNGDSIIATNAKLSGPNGLTIDNIGNIYVADGGNDRVRKITVSTGIITTIAGTGTPGYNGDGILATNAELSSPAGVALDTTGNFYIAEAGNSRIRKINTNTGIMYVYNLSDKVTIYPNPANSILNIQLSSYITNETLQITDVLGRNLEQQALSGIITSIDVSKWSEGVYFYLVRSDKGEVRGKFLKH